MSRQDPLDLYYGVRFSVTPGDMNTCAPTEQYDSSPPDSPMWDSILCGSITSGPAILTAARQTPIWRDGRYDAALAVDEIREIVGQAKITLVGLRLGAVIAARLAAKRSDIIDALVLWDPVISGGEYLQQIGAAAGQNSMPVDADGNIEIYGVPLTETMIRDIASIHPECFVPDSVERALILITERLPSHEWFARSGSRAEKISIEFMSDVRPWLEDTSNTGQLPVGVLQRIVDWLA